MERCDVLRDLMKHFVRTGVPGCALGAAVGGKDLFEHCEGVQSLETNRPLAREHIYRMFSNSKNITMAALLQLFEKGRFLLNDPLEEYLPAFRNPQVAFVTGNNMPGLRPAKSSIRIKDLMTMSSGLTYGARNLTPTHAAVADAIDRLEAAGSYTLQEFALEMAKVPLAFDPGTSWNYGQGHDVAGALVEVLSGMSFGGYLRKEIFEPLGMEDTSFFIDPSKRHRLVSQYRLEDGGALVRNEVRDGMYDPAHRYESGGAGLLSTLPDMMRFAKMLSVGGTLDGVRILSRKTIDLMRQNHLNEGQLAAFRAAHANRWPFLTGYGYGLGVRTMLSAPEAGSNGSVGEFGWAGAAGTWMLVDPSEKLAAVYMHQLYPKNREEYCHPRLRAAIYGMLN